MSKSPVFFSGQGILVTTEGPGKLHLYTYGPVAAGLAGVYGYTETKRHGTSHFVISHSYYYTKYAIYWEGNGSAVYRVGEQREKKPVGKNWNEATWVKWGDTEVEPLEVSPNYFAGAVNRDGQITCFLLPEYL